MDVLKNQHLSKETMHIMARDCIMLHINLVPKNKSIDLIPWNSDILPEARVTNIPGLTRILPAILQPYRTMCDCDGSGTASQHHEADRTHRGTDDQHQEQCGDDTSNEIAYGPWDAELPDTTMRCTWRTRKL